MVVNDRNCKPVRSPTDVGMVEDSMLFPTSLSSTQQCGAAAAARACCARTCTSALPGTRFQEGGSCLICCSAGLWEDRSDEGRRRCAAARAAQVLQASQAPDRSREDAGHAVEAEIPERRTGRRKNLQTLRVSLPRSIPPSLPPTHKNVSPVNEPIDEDSGPLRALDNRLLQQGAPVSARPAQGRGALAQLCDHVVEARDSKEAAVADSVAWCVWACERCFDARKTSTDEIGSCSARPARPHPTRPSPTPPG